MSQSYTQIVEHVLAAESPRKIDRDKGIIYDVKFLGENSRNPPPRNNHYPRGTREKAISLMEGVRVNIDHPKKGEEEQTRSYAAGIGVPRNIREAGDGLRGDFHFNPKHPLAEQIFWDAENCPGNLGFSINGKAKPPVMRDGKRVVEELVELQSVDLVSRPATTMGIFESLEPSTMTVKIRDVLATAFPKHLTLLREMEDAGQVAPAAEMPAPEAGADSTAQANEAFKQMVCAVFDDKSLDMKGKLAKIKEILKSQEKLMGGGEKPAETPTEEKPTEESLKAKLDPTTVQLREELAIRDLIEDAQLKFAKPENRKAFIKSLVPLTESERVSMIEDRKASAPAPERNGVKTKAAPPPSTTPITESLKDRKSFLASITE